MALTNNCATNDRKERRERSGRVGMMKIVNKRILTSMAPVGRNVELNVRYTELRCDYAPLHLDGP